MGEGLFMISVSVVIPVYNAHNYIRSCLDSICTQTLQDIEIICIDDGSTDDSYKILLEYQAKDNRIRIYQQTNQYAGAARNHGMRYATGKYLLFLDADDYFHPTLLEKLYQNAEKYSLQVTLCQYDIYREDIGATVTRDYSETESILPKEKNVFNGKELNGHRVFQLSSGWAWDKLFLREYVQECGYEFPTMRSSEDGYFVYMLLARAERIGYIKERLITYRLGNQNSLSATKDVNWENGFVMLDMIYQELIRLGLYEMYHVSFLRFTVGFVVWYMESMNTIEAYTKCFNRIREEESKYHILQEEGLFCPEYLIVKYKNIILYTLEHYLFSEHKKVKQLQEKETIYRGTNKKGWLFPFEKLPKNQNILLYGAGAVGKAYYKQLSASGFARNVIWVDKSFEKYGKEGYDVESPESVDFSSVDYAIIAILNADVIYTVKSWLEDKGLATDKIID